MKKVIRYTHHTDQPVAVMSHLKGKHKDHCLCWNGCSRFNPGSDDNCPLAKLLYEFDKTYNMVTPVWECPIYETK